MKRTRLPVHARMASTFLLAAVFVLLPFSPGRGISQVRFRTYEDDRPRLERYLDEAKDASTREEFERIMDSGKEALAAAWEREADMAIARALKEASGEEALEAELSRERAAAFEDWERGMSAEVARAEGAYFAARQDLSYADFDRGELRTLLEEAKGAAELGAWDELVDGGSAALTSAWERAFEEKLDRARLAGATLEGVAREEYEREIARMERDVRGRFDLERGGLVYRARNAYITDRYLDTDSLRRASEEASAEAIAARIVRETEEAVRADEDEILKRPEGAEPGDGGIDFSSLGDNWKEELERLVERGLERWRAAQEELYRSMLSWKSAAEEAYDAGNAKWARAYDEIYRARDAWQSGIAAEIDEGLARWAEEEAALSENLETARSDFREYVETLRGQWDEHSNGLVDMADSGSRVYGEAVESVAWLEAMCEKYENDYAIREYNDLVKDAINATTGGRIDAALAEYAEWLGDAASVNLTFLDASMDADGAYHERYRVKIVWSSSGWFTWTIDDFVWTNTMTAESDARLKSSYYYYYTELVRWRELRDAFKETVEDAERYMHERNMVGWGEYGPGFLVNAEGEYEPNPEWENDPYLMTEAERAYALAEKELEYWRGRLAIAEAVKAYAGGERGSAEATIAAKDAARTALDGAKAAYEEELSGIAGIVARLKAIQGARPVDDDATAWEAYRGSIEFLSGELAAASAAMEEKRETLLAIQRALIVMENGEGSDFVAKELREIEENLARTEKELSEKRFDYYMKSREAERLERLSDYARLYGEALYAREGAKGSLQAFEAIVSGEETDGNLPAWVAALEGVKSAVWGASGDETYARLASLESAWEGASGDEKAGAREALSLFFRGEHARLRAEYEKHDGIFALLRDQDMNVTAYLEGGVGRDVEAYANAAELNHAVFELVGECADELGEDEGYALLLERLRARLEATAYVYGGDNRAYLTAFAAYAWARDHLVGADREAIAARVDYEKETADSIRDLYDDFGGFDPAALIAAADGGDGRARAVLGEYYGAGSAMAALGYIETIEPSLALRDYARRAKYEFAAQNAASLPWNESSIRGRDFSAEMLDYINAKLGAEIIVGEDGIDALDPETLAAVAGALSEYLDERTAAREALPGALGEIIRSALAARDRLAEYLYLGEHGAEENPQALLEAATEESGVASAVFAFVDGLGERFAEGGDIAAYIMNTYRTLGEGVRTYLAESADAALRGLSEMAAYLDGIRFAMEKRALGSEFLAMDGAMTVAQFVEARGASYGAGEREALAAYLEILREKRLYDELDLEGSLMEYLEGRALAGGAYDELKRYALIDRFLDLAAGGFTDRGEPLFEKFARYRDFEASLRSGARLEGESDGEYAARMAAEFAAANPAGEGESYADFAEDFLSGATSAFTYLPGDVQFYVAANDYYDGVFAGGGVVRGGELDSFTGARYGSGSLEAAVRERLAAYVEGLGGIDTWYGQETSAYLAGLSETAREGFRTYLYVAGSNGPGDALRAGFAEGVYGLEDAIAADMALLGGMAGEVVGELTASFDAIYKAARRDAEDKKRAESHARALVKLKENPGLFESYRNYLIGATDADGNPTITVEPLDGGSVIDGRDAETGAVNRYRYVPAESGPNGTSMLGSLIVEESNRLAGELRTLFAAGKAEVIPSDDDGVYGIAQFLDRADGIYDTEETYTRDAEGNYAFKDALDELLSGVLAYADAHGNESLSGLADELASMEYATETYRERIIDRGKTYRLMGGDADALRGDMEAASYEHRAAEEAYRAVKTALDARRADYETANAEYIAAMNATAERYAVYRERELAWEKAYAVWEYANTPYLKESSPRDAGLGSGNAPGGGVNEYDEIDAPDALDVYNRVSARYEEANAAFEAARAKKETQETLAKLRADETYAALRADLERKTASYARTAQVYALVEEKLAAVKKEYEDALSAYERAKEGVNFNPKTEDGELDMTEEETALRDRILEHIIGSGAGEGRIEEYLTAFFQYDDYLKIKATYASSIAGENHPGVLEAKAKIDPVVFADIEAIYESLDHETIDTMISEYRLMVKYYGDYQHYARRERRCKVNCGSLRNRRDDNLSRYVVHNKLYTAARDRITESLEEALAAKQALVEKEAAYRTLDDARSLADIRTVLMNPPYGLTEEDLSHLYDATTASTHERTAESVNVEGLRKEKARTDADGYALRAEKEGERIYILAQDGTRTGESYALDDASVRLKDEGGAIPDLSALADGEIHTVYDRVYSLEEVTRAMRETYRNAREGYRDEYRAFARRSVESGAHDATVLFRDEEELYNGLLLAARDFGAAYGELRQRSYDGYRTIVSEMVRNADGSAVQQRIVNALVTQNAAIQEKEWSELRAKFDERKERWMETVGFIWNRGARDWTSQQNRLLNRWTAWRIDAREAISAGEAAWMDEQKAFSAAMDEWRAATSKDSAEAVALLSAEETARRIDGFMNELKRKNMPGVDLDFDADSLVREALKNAPPASIGALADTMNTLDTTAGFAVLLNLNLGGSLEARYAEEMKDYAERMSVMQNLRVTDILQGIIDSFNAQLLEANADVYESVDTDIRTQFAAPFLREEGARRWKIEVVKESNLFGGDKKKTIRFADYADYATDAVTLKPLKGLSGTIDFTDPATYMNVDADELDVYVRLASENLNRAIEGIFGADGSFPTHTDAEFERLGNRFSKAYEEYMKGQALAASGWYAKNDFVMVNSALGVAAYALSSITCGISMGVYMGLQAAITLNRAYDEGGMKGLATSAGSLGISAYVQAVSAGMMDVNFSYTRDGGFGGMVSFGNQSTWHAGVGYSQNKDWNANVGYQQVTVGVSKTGQDGWGGSVKLGAYEASYSEKQGFGTAISVNMGQYGSMRFGMQFDDHMGWKGANVNYNTPASGDKYFSGTQSFGFGYNKDSGYSLTAGTTVNTAAGLGTNTTNTFMFDKGGTFSGATLDTSMRYSYDNYKDMREKSEQVDREMTETERSDAQRKSEDLSLWDRLDLAASGMWESMKGSLSGGWEGVMASLTGAWDDITKLPERITNWVGDNGFTTNREVAANAAMKEYEAQNRIAEALKNGNYMQAGSTEYFAAKAVFGHELSQEDEAGMSQTDLAAYYEAKLYAGNSLNAVETLKYESAIDNITGKDAISRGLEAYGYKEVLTGGSGSQIKDGNLETGTQDLIKALEQEREERIKEHNKIVGDLNRTQGGTWIEYMYAPGTLSYERAREYSDWIQNEDNKVLQILKGLYTAATFAPVMAVDGTYDFFAGTHNYLKDQRDMNLTKERVKEIDEMLKKLREKNNEK
ncbi:MAG: hypothetical protein AB2L13_19980 [Spirochaetota bacterium]